MNSPKANPIKIHRPLLLSLGQALFSIFQENRYADKVIERYLKSHPKWGSRDRKFFAESVYEVVRHYYRYAYLAGVSQPQSEQDFLNLWAVYAYEKWELSEVLGVSFDPQLYKEKRQALDQEPLWLQHSWPQELDNYMELQLPHSWMLLRDYLNQMAPVDLRANTLKIGAKELLQALAKEDILSHLIEGLPDGLSLDQRRNIFISESFKKGYFEVQDRSSQKVALLLDPQPGERVCDACAGSGGKSLHIANLMKNKGRILSLDTIQWKLDELRSRASRNGVSIIETRLIEGTKTIKRQQENFDRVLLDVPCSGLGVVRRNPDTKWKFHFSRLSELIELQSQILELYSKMVKPGGVLVYATCSILPEENEKQIQKFLEDKASLWTCETLWTSNPSVEEGDGFFAAKLRRS
jgi:16S rRNA (cytosine967-C5)-methyltransferase